MLPNALKGLSLLGWCNKCEQFIAINSYGSLKPHTNQQSDNCTNEGYSCGITKYFDLDPSQAEMVARTILEDNSVCLSGQSLHSMGCHDGQLCAEERHRRSQALAKFVEMQMSNATV